MTPFADFAAHALSAYLFFPLDDGHVVLCVLCCVVLCCVVLCCVVLFVVSGQDADRAVQPPTTGKPSFVAGYPGVPPAPANQRYYNTTRAVHLVVQLDATAAASAPAAAAVESTALTATATVRVINDTCANSKAVWVSEMGSVTWCARTYLRSRSINRPIAAAVVWFTRARR